MSAVSNRVQFAGAALAALLSTSVAWGQSFSHNAGGPGAQIGQQPMLLCGTTELTQSSSQAIAPLNSVSCNNLSLGHAENSYYRVFDLPSFGIADSFEVCEVQIGVEDAVGGNPTQPLILNLYTNSGAPFPNGTLDLVATRNFAIQDQSLTLLSLPIAAHLPVGAQLVVEVLTPDGQAGGYFFFIGSNSAPETAPSYLRAPDCGFPTPATTAAIGFPDMHIVMNVRGSSAAAPAPALGPAALAFLVTVFGFIAAWRLRTGATRH